MARRRNGHMEIFAPTPARSLVINPPIVYQEYPKTLVHPRGHDNYFPPIIVNDWSQECEYAAKGYEPPGKADSFGFLTSRATEKVDDAIRLMNEHAETKIAEGQARIEASLREYMESSLEQINDVIDALRISHARVPLIDKELARIRGKMMNLENILRGMAKGTKPYAARPEAPEPVQEPIRTMTRKSSWWRSLFNA